MNDLIRPGSLLRPGWTCRRYARATPRRAATTWSGRSARPVTSSPRIATWRSPKATLLAVRSAGAYGFVMSSNYNTRGRAAEVLVDGEQTHEVRRRETVQELYAGESLLP